MTLWLILLGYALLVTFAIMFFMGASSRYEEEDIGPINDTYHGEGKDERDNN